MGAFFWLVFLPLGITFLVWRDRVKRSQMVEKIVAEMPMPEIRLSHYKILVGDVSGEKHYNLNGWIFCAKLDLTTPLSVLKSHGFWAKNESNKFEDEGFGNWLPYMLDGDTHKPIEREEIHHAQLFGLIDASRVVGVLMDARETIENTQLSAPQIFDKLNALAGRDDVSRRVIAARLDKKGLKSAGVDTLGKLWAFQNLDAIKGVGPSTAKKLIADGIFTVEQYEKYKNPIKQ